MQSSSPHKHLFNSSNNKETEVVSQNDLNSNHKLKSVARFVYNQNDQYESISKENLDWLAQICKKVAQVDKQYGISKKQITQNSSDFIQLFVSEKVKGNFLFQQSTFLPYSSVLPISGRVDAIYSSLKQSARLQRQGIQAGFNLSTLSPKGILLSSASQANCGPIELMNLMQYSSQVLHNSNQSNSFKPHFSLRIDHPDIEEFLICKQKNQSLKEIEFSILVTDEFMMALQQKDSYNLIDPFSKKVAKKKQAQDIFDLICAYIYEYGEPRIVFIDKVNQANPIPELNLASTISSYSKQPLLPYEIDQNLQIDLYKMLKKDDQNKSQIDWELLKECVQISVHFLDNLIDAQAYPIANMQKMNKANRRIHLGITNFAKMLIELQISYNSAQAIEIASSLGEFIQKTCLQKTQKLAEQKGSFANFMHSTFKQNGIQSIRNASITMISSGLQALSYLVKPDLQYDSGFEIEPLFEQACKKAWVYTNQLMEDIATDPLQNLNNITKLPQSIKDLFITNSQVDYKQQIAIQSAFQAYTDNSVILPIYLNKQVLTHKQIQQICLLSYKSECRDIAFIGRG
jgi:ribonucleoside-diphosphate reductase alpha chain